MGLKWSIAIFSILLSLTFGRQITLEKISLTLTDDSTDDELTSRVVETFFGTQLAALNDTDCKDGKCEACAGTIVKACFVATLGTDSFSLAVTINGVTVVSTTINVPNPPPICKALIPGLPSVSDVCVKLDNVDLQKGAACVYVTLKVNIGIVEKNLSFKIACFSINAFVDETIGQDEFKPEDKNTTSHVTVSANENAANSTSSEVERAKAALTLFFKQISSSD